LRVAQPGPLSLMAWLLNRQQQHRAGETVQRSDQV
jgi:hypothetical protein